MVSLRPKEGGGVLPPGPRPQRNWSPLVLPLALLIAFVAIAAVGYNQHSANTALEDRIAALEQQVHQDLKQDLNKMQASTNDLASDLDVVRKRMGVTAQELADSRKFAEKLRQDHERAKEQLASELAGKANTTEVAAVREEATSKVAAVQKDADAKIGNVSGEVKTVAGDVKTVAGNLEATRFALGRKNGIQIEVNGSKGSLYFDFEDMNRLKFYNQNDPDDRRGFRDILVTEGVHPFVGAWWPPGHIIGYEHTFTHSIRDFVDAVALGRPVSPDFVDGLRNQQVLEAVEKSSKSGRWTKVS